VREQSVGILAFIKTIISTLQPFNTGKNRIPDAKKGQVCEVTKNCIRRTAGISFTLGERQSEKAVLRDRASAGAQDGKGREEGGNNRAGRNAGEPQSAPCRITPARRRHCYIM